MTDERLEGRLASAQAELREQIDPEAPRIDAVVRRQAIRHRPLLGLGALAVVIVSAFAVSAQMRDSGSNVVASDGEPDEAGEPIDETPSPSTSVLTIEEIEAREAAWKQKGPGAYRYVIDSTCGCDWQGTFEVTVVDGEVVMVVPTHAGAEPYRRYFSQSVDEMFGMFKEALTIAAEEGADARVAATFDEQMGYPVDFSVQWAAGGVYWGGGGDGYNATISDLTPINPQEVGPSDSSTVPLVISNQSYDHPEALVEVRIDGDVVVDSSFPVEGQHTYATYDLPLAPGTHELVATSDAGARISQVIEVVPDEPYFLTLLHWTAEEPGQEPAYFNFTASDQPPGFG